MNENENIGHGKDYDGSEFFGGGSNNTARDFGGDSDRSFETPDIDTTELSSTESAFESESNPIADSMRDLIKSSTTEQENSNAGNQIDTSFQIGDINEDLEKARQSKEFNEERLEQFNKLEESITASLEKAIKDIDSKNPFDKLASAFTNNASKTIDSIAAAADKYGVELDRAKLESDFRKGGTDVLRQAMKDVLGKARSEFEARTKAASDNYDKLKSSFTDNAEPAKAKDKPSTPSEVMKEATGPGDKMKNAKTSASDYLTSANKDAPKTARDTHDNFLEHALDTTAGAMDRVSKTTTDLGIKDLKAWAEENGKDPSKLSTMRAYNVYQMKEIYKAVPGVMKEVGSYIEERVKDAFDPSKLGTRVANTLARYNAASLIGAAILSLKYGSNFTEALDMALSSVDPADVPEVREALENALNDDSLVDDVSTLIDDAYSNMNSSKQGDIDSEIVNIGRKNQTDYSDFNAGLGTTSDKDVKVFISRNVKSDPVLRALVKKLVK